MKMSLRSFVRIAEVKRGLLDGDNIALYLPGKEQHFVSEANVRFHRKYVDRWYIVVGNTSPRQCINVRLCNLAGCVAELNATMFLELKRYAVKDGLTVH